VLALLFALFLEYIPGLGFIDLVSGVVFSGTESVLNTGYGILAGIVIPAGFLVQARASVQKIVGLQQAAMAALALVVAGLLSLNWNAVGAGVVVAVLMAILLALHPAPKLFVTRGDAFSRVLVGLVIMAANPCVVYAIRMAANARAKLPPLGAESNGVLHWTALTALCIAVLLVGLLAATRTVGRRLPAWTVGGAALVWGFVSMRDPDVPASGGRMWGALVIAWGIVFIAAAEWEARRDPAR